MTFGEDKSAVHPVGRRMSHEYVQIHWRSVFAFRQTDRQTDIAMSTHTVKTTMQD